MGEPTPSSTSMDVEDSADGVSRAVLLLEGRPCLVSRRSCVLPAAVGWMTCPPRLKVGDRIASPCRNCDERSTSSLAIQIGPSPRPADYVTRPSSRVTDG